MIWQNTKYKTGPIFCFVFCILFATGNDLIAFYWYSSEKHSFSYLSISFLSHLNPLSCYIMIFRPPPPLSQWFERTRKVPFYIYLYLFFAFNPTHSSLRLWLLVSLDNLNVLNTCLTLSIFPISSFLYLFLLFLFFLQVFFLFPLLSNCAAHSLH